MRIALRALVLAAATLVPLAAGAQSAIPAPKDADECRRIAATLDKRADALHRRTRQIIPRELARVAANLDDFCDEGAFDKAHVSIAWIENCLAHFTDDQTKGFCTRSRSYFCAVLPDSDGCKAP